MDRNAKTYFDSSLALLLPVKAIDYISGFELTLGKNSYFFSGAQTPLNNECSANLAEIKPFTNKLLEAAGIPVPKFIWMYKNQFTQGLLEEQLQSLQFPLVLKPVDGCTGADVLCNIKTIEELKIHLKRYFSGYNQVLLEEFHHNLLSYRILIFKQRIIGVVLRHPAHVVGDGKHSIRGLIKISNAQRKKINKFIGPISLDYEADIRLKELGITADYIPVAGEKIVLAYTSNATRGGTFETISKKICKENRQLFIKVSKVLNLKLAGIDVQCSDLNRPIRSSRGVIIEVNQRPSIRIHELPMIGNPQLVSRNIMRSFIYRHPFAYLYALYLNKQTSVYCKSTLLTLMLVLVYYLISKVGL